MCLKILYTTGKRVLWGAYFWICRLRGSKALCRLWPSGCPSFNTSIHRSHPRISKSEHWCVVFVNGICPTLLEFSYRSWSFCSPLKIPFRVSECHPYVERGQHIWTSDFWLIWRFQNRQIFGRTHDCIWFAIGRSLV